MASASSTFKFLSLLVALFAVAEMAITGESDPDSLSDFAVPQNATMIDGTFFTFTGMRALTGAPPVSAFKVSKTLAAEFPALNGQSVSNAVLQFPAGNTNPPHTHPRPAELPFLVDGSLQVGFVDTTNKLFTQTLQSGDMFIFPKGLVHFQYNADSQNSALAISVFGSASAGPSHFLPTFSPPALMITSWL